MDIINLIKIAECSDKFAYIDQKGIKDALSKETGRDRIIRMFSKNEMGFISPELRYLTQSSFIITVLSGFWGATVHMNKARDDFIRKNMASAFESQHFAKRKLLDTMTLAGLNGAYKYGLQYGAFSSIYMLSTMTIQNYRNKMSIWEHIGTAAVLGGLSRVKFGLKGIFVASCLGSILGAIAGGIIMLNMRLAGVTVEDFRYWQHEHYYTEVLKKKPEEES